MRRPRAFVVVCAVLPLMIAFGAAVASGQDDVSKPYGKYEGSAAGSQPDAQPFAATLYVNEGDDGRFAVTVVTGALPIPVTVQGVPKSVSGGWDVPVNVSVDTISLFGDGVVRLRQRDGKWLLFGSGSGSFGGNSGSGFASGKGAAGASSVGAQVLDAAEGFFSFGGSGEEPIPMPAEYDEAEWAPPAEPADTVAEPGSGTGGVQLAAADAVVEQPPPSDVEMIVFFFIGLLMAALGII